MKHENEAFYYLWNNGFRFLTEDDADSLRHGLYQKSNGLVTGYTIQGLKNLAKEGNLLIDEVKLTEEEVEIIFNYIKFKRQLK